VPMRQPLPWGGGLILFGAVTGFLAGVGVGVCVSASALVSAPLSAGFAVPTIIAAAFFGVLIGLAGSLGAYLGYRLTRERRPQFGVALGSATFFVLAAAVVSAIPGWGQFLPHIAIVELLLGTAAFVVFATVRTQSIAQKPGVS